MLDGMVYFFSHFFGEKRLGDKITGAEIESLFCNGIAGTENDYGNVRDVLYLFEIPQSLKYGKTVHARHEDIEDYEFRSLGGDDFESVFTAGGGNDVETERAKTQADESKNPGFVVNHKDSIVFPVSRNIHQARKNTE
jgi:hypothetical protein